jgi:hypothetical protein
MKRANQILIFCFFIAFAISCNKKSDDGVSPATSAIVGKWKDAGTKGSMTVNLLGQTSTESLDEPATGEIVEFKSDGTVVDFSAPGDDSQFTKYKTSGNQLILTGTETASGKSFDFAFNYSISGKTMKLTMDNALFKQNITAISKAGGDGDLADLAAFLEFITDIKYEGTLEKQ